MKTPLTHPNITPQKNIPCIGQRHKEEAKNTFHKGREGILRIRWCGKGDLTHAHGKQATSETDSLERKRRMWSHFDKNHLFLWAFHVKLELPGRVVLYIRSSEKSILPNQNGRFIQNSMNTEISTISTKQHISKLPPPFSADHLKQRHVTKSPKASR